MPPWAASRIVGDLAVATLMLMPVAAFILGAMSSVPIMRRRRRARRFARIMRDYGQEKRGGPRGDIPKPAPCTPQLAKGGDMPNATIRPDGPEDKSTGRHDGRMPA